MHTPAVIPHCYLYTAANSPFLSVFELFEKIRSYQAKHEEEKRLQKQLEDERFRKNAWNEWIRWAIDVLLAIAIFIAGLVVEHYSSPFHKFVEFVKGLW